MTEIKTMSPHGINFLVKEEGLVLHPYIDAVGVATIGVGSTYWEDGRRVKMTDRPISRERAIQLFRHTLRHYETAVWSSTRDDINQNMFDALVSLCYNIGVNAFKNSTVVKRVNKNPLDPSIREAFMMWRNAGGKPILLNRRKREAALYFK